MRTKILLAVLIISTAWCFAQPASDTVIGLLRGNDYPVRGEFVTWFPRMGVPTEILTIGWSVEPGELDTFWFTGLDDWYGAAMTYFSGGFLTCSIVPLVQDSWYDLPVPEGSDDSVLPQVMFYEYFVGCEEESNPQLPAVLSPVSNPSRGRAAFRYYGLPGPLAVHAGDGRLVRVLAPTAGGRGDPVEWDGTDQRGAKQPTGVYYCRALAEPGSPAVRFVMFAD